MFSILTFYTYINSYLENYMLFLTNSLTLVGWRVLSCGQFLGELR